MAPEAERLGAFDHLLAEMAAVFLSRSAEAIDGAILSSLERVAHFLGIESATAPGMPRFAAHL